MENNQLAEAFSRLTIVQLAAELGMPDVQEGTGKKSPFREDKKAGSFSVQRAYFKDHAHDEHSGGHIRFVELARPGWSKKECIEFIIKAAGMEPEKQSAGTVKAIAKEKRERVFSRQRERVAELPTLGVPEPPPMDKPVRDRWNEGQSALIEHLEKLAGSRGWPVEAMRALIGMNKTSLPLLPWTNDHRGWGWIVEKPVFDQRGRAGLIPVGYHSRYKIFKAGEEPSKRWVYCPYVPASERLSDFQQYLKTAGWKLPAYPFVLGDLNCPRLVVILEGQFDAVSFALSFGWLVGGIPPGVVVFGLRGVSSPGVLLAAYGPWLRRHTPFVWVFPDNDAAGRQLIERKNPERIDSEPCFIDRIRAQGCRTVCQLLPVEGCKDFNDIWREHRPSAERMQALADGAGCGELTTGLV